MVEREKVGDFIDKEIRLLTVIFYRVALSPQVTAALVKKGFTVNIEKGAGVQAKFRDEDYLAAGGNIVDGNKAWDTGKTKNIFPPKNTT